MNRGFAGKLASAFVNSKLTPLLILASLVLGVFAVIRTPREEEPQIIVPMADVLVQFPGATVKEVEQRITSPLEKLIWEVPGVEYVYSTSGNGRAMVVVRFLVGQDQEKAFVRLREKISGNADLIPQGASAPIIKTHSIDDVAVLALTLHSQSASPVVLRQIASRLEQEIKSVPDVAETLIIGGQKRELLISVNKAVLAGNGLDIAAVTTALQQANQEAELGSFAEKSQSITLRANGYFRSVDDILDVRLAASGGQGITVRDIATVTDGPAEAVDYVLFGNGAASESKSKDQGITNAVTISVAKRQGVNAIDVVHQVLAKVDRMKGIIIPGDISVTVTRNYGETSAEKSNELLFHMGIAVVSVTILIAIALGKKESMVVLTAIPVTLALTLLVFYLYGYTLNRITLFALIFSIGILVDDAIVVVENIVRHLRMPDAQSRGLLATAIDAVDEVGNPTILATFAVIAAILPLAFVGGLMGPYMRPIPIGASAAMLFSLLIAFIVTPWAAVRILRKEGKESAAGGGVHHGDGPEDRLTILYRHIMQPLLRSWKVRSVFFLMVGILMAASMYLLANKSVTVKMLPFDNKNEFQVIVDMPKGTSLETTLAATRELAEKVAKTPEVVDYQIYAGTSSPYNFNGLVRHYFMRHEPFQADIQVNLLPKGDRKRQSHDIAKSLRAELAPIATKLGARIKIAEVPPGPPVLQTLVAEVYGPDDATRLAVAARVKDVFETTEGVADIDWYVDADHVTRNIKIDAVKAAASGVTLANAQAALRIALSGGSVGLMHEAESREDINAIVRLERGNRSGSDSIEQLQVRTMDGRLVPLSELVTTETTGGEKSIYHKNLQPVVYVTGDVVGRQESPVYAILKMNAALDKLDLPGGVKLNVMTTHVPDDTRTPAMKWDGEWHITYEVFRDLGIAFAAVLILIYILVVAWFQDFRVPIVIMAPIPLTLIGILPAHAMLGAFFTATSMIGFIAGAGIIVRNSIILVDFIELQRKQGASLEQAVVDAGAIRFRPMLLTATAVIVGSFVILFDPIFQGLAVALMAGEIASTLLSRLAVPVLYYMAEIGKERKALSNVVGS
jgi:multidrug efflux pump subunit AcrB